MSEMHIRKPHPLVCGNTQGSPDIFKLSQTNTKLYILLLFLSLMEKQIVRKYFIIAFITILGILAFLVIKPLFVSIVVGALLAYIFNPLYKLANKRIKNSNISATLMCIILILIILLPLLFLTPIIVQQGLSTYNDLKYLNLKETVQKIFPFFSEKFILEVINLSNKFFSDSAVLFFEKLTDFILNIPIMLLQTFVVLIIFFYTLRNQKLIVEYAKTLTPLNEASVNRFVTQSRQLTNSIVFGNFLTGLIQGLATGFGLLIFGVKNVALLTILAIFLGIVPIIGPLLIWLPAALLLIANGNTVGGIGLLIYGFIVISWIDNIIRPYFVSKKTKIPVPILLVGMIGGMFFFGVLGLVLGPLILVYLLIILEFCQKRRFSELFSD